MSLYVPLWILYTLVGVVGCAIGFLVVCGVLYLLSLRAFDQVMRRHFGWCVVLAVLLLGGCCISPFCTGPKEETSQR